MTKAKTNGGDPAPVLILGRPEAPCRRMQALPVQPRTGRASLRHAQDRLFDSGPVDPAQEQGNRAKTVTAGPQWSRTSRCNDLGARIARLSALSRSALPSVLLISLGLAGCESVGAVGSVGMGIAEVTPPSKDSSVNLASLSDVVARNPRDAEAYNTRGAAYARTGDFDKAIGDFTKAVQIDPKNAAAYTNRALAYRQTSRNDLALADFNHALESNANHAPAYLGRGNLLRAQGNYPQALADLDQAIKLNSEGALGAQAFHARGLIHQRQGEQALAITDFDNAIDRDPFAAAPYQARAQSLTAEGKYAQAIEDDNAALNVDSKNAEAWADLGVAYEKSGNNSKARESYSRAKVIDPNNRVASDGLSRMS